MRIKPVKKISSYVTVIISLITVFLLLFGCSGDNGSSGTSSGIVAGQVTDTAGNKLAGINVSPSPAVNGVANVTTDGNGNYSMTIPNGNFSLTFAKAGYTSQTLPVTVVATQTTTLNAILTQTAAAVVNVANSQFVNGTATLTATALVNDPALKGQPVTFTWTLPDGTTATGASINVTKPSSAAYKLAVANAVAPLSSIEPGGVIIDPVTGEENAHTDIPVFTTLDRVMVVGITPKAFDDAALATYTVTATINGQTFASAPTVSVPTNTLPFVPNPGLRNVPIGQPVMLQGMNTASWNWTITPAVGSVPANSALKDPTTRFPHFIPDAVGTYVVTESVSGKSLNIYAGKYVGILVPALPSNDPLGALDVGCSQAGCHTGTPAFGTINSRFTDWKLSGHSAIMVNGMKDPAGHYSLTSCAVCHSVGFAQFSSAIKAGGFDETYRAAKFTFKQGSPTFVGFDQVLRLSEVQCESCHGPNNSGAHGTFTASPQADQPTARVSVSADVCGVCHGEPLRHGRFQEWRESGHGDFETAMGEGITGVAAATPTGTGPNSGCAGCHTAQGFLLWISQLQAGSSSRTLNAANLATISYLRTDNAQPQTCVTCHTPHNAGSVSGLVGAVVILRGDYQTGGAFDGITPILPAGFQAAGVGKGALCITCHNSRNGEPVSGAGNATLHEDGDVNWGTLTAYAGPHDASQGDVLMGRNAYFFGTTPGLRSKHSLLADACVTCHLLKTAPDPNFGYPAGVSGAGTNHTFAIASDPNKTVNAQVNALCAQCHGSGFDGTGVQKSFNAANNLLLAQLANATLRLKYGSTGAIPAGTTLIFIPGRSPAVSTDNGVTSVSLASYLTGAPGTANLGGTVTATGFNQVLAKANWNAALVGQDSSEGVHNPSFTFSVITNTTNAVQAL
jgi:hypothetical protein